MTIQQNIKVMSPATDEAGVEIFVGPCGCPVCEKWADCDWCGTCSPDEPILSDEFIAEMNYYGEADESTFAEWLLGRDEE